MQRFARAWGIVLLAVGLPASVAQAQMTPTQKREAAAEAFDKGSTAYLAGEYATAGKWFETAYRMAPNSAALLQAVRAYEHGEDLPRAATLSLLIMQGHSGDDAAVAHAEGVLEQLAPHLFRVDVVCDECSLEVDGALMEYRSFFVEPDTTHELVAAWNAGRRRGEIRGKPGESRVVELEAPAPTASGGAAQEEDMSAILGDSSKLDEPYEPEREDETPRREEAEGEPFGPAVPIVGIGLTVVAAGVAVWSTIDMNGGVDEYEAAAEAAVDCTSNCARLEEEARQLLADGQSTETRSTVLWVVTGGLGAFTLISAAFLTDWGGGESAPSDEATLRWQLHADAEHAGAALAGRF